MSRFALRWRHVALAVGMVTVWLATRSAANVGPATTTSRGPASSLTSTPHGGLSEIHASAATPRPPAEKRPHSAGDGEAAPVSTEERERYLRSFHEAQSKLVADTFNAESVEAGWNLAAETSLKRLYAGDEFKPLQTDVECRSTLCRVKFSYDDAATGAPAVQRLIARRPWATRAYTRHDTNERSGVSYIAREGRTMPRVDPTLLSH